MICVMNEPFTIPIVYVIFNRPNLTKITFAQIQALRPKYLYVVADGPRLEKSSDQAKCLSARKIVKEIDWDCEVTYDFSEENLGCKKRVSSGITNAFKVFSEAIILEDDCLPHPGFFQFCKEMLDTYRQNNKIMHISGNYFHGTRKFNEHDYYFSQYPHVWGWATWKRAWKKYDPAMKVWPEFNRAQGLKKLNLPKNVRKCFKNRFDAVYNNIINTWDYQWVFQLFLNQGLSINPKVNLISNIGFGKNSTHTNSSLSPFANMQTSALSFPLKHPEQIALCREADNQTAAMHFISTDNSIFHKWKRSFTKRYNRLMKPLKRHGS